MTNQFALLAKRNFAPFFVAQFLGAFNDNFCKTLVSVMIAYGLLDIGTIPPGTLLALAAGLFVIPFVLFTPLAGDLADKYDKAQVIYVLKGTEILIVFGGLAGLYLGSIPILFLMLFALGAQSAFFSPAKFSIMPQHLERHDLIGGNALVNTGTYLAILLGTIFGSLLAVSRENLVIAAVIIVLCTLAGYFSSRYIPSAPPKASNVKLRFNVLFEAVRILIYAAKMPGRVFPAMLCAAWFFFVGALYLSQFPNYTSEILGVDNMVLTFFMGVFSVGIALGGLLNNVILKSEIRATFVPFAALLMGVFSVDLFFASQPYAEVPQAFRDSQLLELKSFLAHFSGWRIVIDLLAIALAGGLYAVPLKTIIQDRTPSDHCARVMAGSSLMDALFVLTSTALAIVAFSKGYNVTDLFLVSAVGSVIFAVFAALMFFKIFNSSKGHSKDV